MRGRMPPRALIIGGSLAGLFAANLLRKIGWETIVCERSSHALASRGAGISSHDLLLPLLREIGIDIDGRIGIETSDNICVDRGGLVTHRVPIVPPRVASAWGRVYRPLRHRLPSEDYRCGMTCVGVEQVSGRVAAIFADGTRLEGDLLIAADGVQSTVRQLISHETRHRCAGYVCWRFVIPERDLAPDLRSVIAPYFAFCFAENQMMHGFLIPGANDETAPGERAYCIVWYRCAARDELQRLLSDETGRRHEISIPPSLIRNDVIREIRKEAEIFLPPAFAQSVAQVERPLLQGIVDLESSRLVFGRVALMGDAAFTARPHVAAGVIKAALDAESLARNVGARDNLDEALARYEEERRRVGQAIVARGRYLGAHLERQPPAAPRSRGRTGRTPEEIMRDYGRSNLGATPVV